MIGAGDLLSMAKARIKELEAEILGWQGKSIEREQHLQIANSAVEELTAKLDMAREALKFYADKSSYDCDYDVGMEVSHRCILYKDQYDFGK